MKKVVLNISGKSCSGKSTVVDTLFRKIEGIYLVSYDKTKWRLSGYDRDKHSKIIKRITFGLLKSVCEAGLPVLLDGSPSTKEEYLEYLKVSGNNGYEILSFNLTAPEDVLLQRFRQRVKEAKDKGWKVSVMTEDLFLQNQKREWFVPEDAVSFDTSVLSPEEIVEEIERKLLNF